MRTVNIHEAKTHLSRLVEQAADGEGFIIAKAGKPMVKVVALGAAEIKAPRRLGFMEGEATVPDDFDTMFADEILAMFEGQE
jgi:prevent-host-death family protein